MSTEVTQQVPDMAEPFQDGTLTGSETTPPGDDTEESQEDTLQDNSGAADSDTLTAQGAAEMAQLTRVSSELDPQKEPLHFDFQTDGLDAETIDLRNKIKELAEKQLYHWKNFPIKLPESISDQTRDTGQGLRRQVGVKFQDLFITPTFDELEEVAQDISGQAKKLDNQQLCDVQELGEFEVESLHFHGQAHRWRLSQLLQKGSMRSHATLLDDAALALRLLIITARNRFCSHFFSLASSFKHLMRGLWKLLDIIFGMPSTSPGDIMGKIRDEHIRFLVAELDVRPVCKEDWISYVDYFQEKNAMVQSEKYKTTEFAPPLVPYRYQTPKGFDIDLRLFNRDLIQRCCKLLKDILERESKGWHIKFKEALIRELRGQNLSTEQISQKVNEAILEEYLRRVYVAILNSDHLENMQPRLGALIVAQAKAALIMEKAIENVKQKLRRHRLELEEHLVSAYPVRSRITAWKNERLQTFEEEFTTLHRWTAHEEALEMCKKEALGQAVYFLHRDLIFMRDREPVLQKELSKVGIPNRVFSFRTRIWCPQNWRITHHLQGESHRIPTIVSLSACTHEATLPRNNPNRPRYAVEKYIYRKTSTRYPLWRWLNYLQRTWAWMWNMMFLLGVVIPWCSPVSLRALFSPREFMPVLELNQISGSLCPSKTSTTHSMVSWLRELWAHVRESRIRFESEPDTSFLDKTFSRHLNRLWNYVLKGVLGSLAIVLVFPILCILVSAVSFGCAVTCPVWMPAITLLAHLFEVIIFDFDHPDHDNPILYLFEAIIWRILILGCFQPLIALIGGVIVCPIAAFGVAFFGIMRRGCRAVWDTFMFHAVIKSRGRIPAKDGFVARRIAGPGLASNYFCQISQEQALAAAEAQVELHELQAWRENITDLIDLPKREYSQFIEKCFHPFSASLCREGVYKALEEETDLIHEELKLRVNRRQEMLQTGLTPELRKKIKLPEKHLKVVIGKTADMLREEYPSRVIDRLPCTTAEFWESKNLEQENWIEFAAQILSEVFSLSFLTPLEDTDTIFHLEVEHLNLRRYQNMLRTASYRDDLDIIQIIHTPKGDIDVDVPYLDVSMFSPVWQNIRYAHYLGPKEKKRKLPWKRPYKIMEELEKMEIPTPVPHPGKIALLIHNRENDQEPIVLEDPFCEQILKAAESVPYARAAYLESIDIEASTPDHLTASEPEVVLSHIAEPERAFSEDTVAIQTPDSMNLDDELGEAGAFVTIPLRQLTGLHDDNLDEDSDGQFHDAEEQTPSIHSADAMLLNESTDHVDQDDRQMVPPEHPYLFGAYGGPYPSIVIHEASSPDTESHDTMSPLEERPLVPCPEVQVTLHNDSDSEPLSRGDRQDSETDIIWGPEISDEIESQEFDFDDLKESAIV